MENLHMEQVSNTFENKSPAGTIIPSGGIRCQLLPQPSLQPAVPGNLSDPKEERMDRASAVSDTAAADCAWNYASLRTSDFLLMPSSVIPRRFGPRHFGVRFGF
jgi:hypothetical protein